MKLSAHCMTCLINRQMESIVDNKDEELKASYMKEILTIIAAADEEETAPEISAKIEKEHKKYFKTFRDFSEIKSKYNNMMLQKEESIWNKIQSSKDSLLEALKFARVGNYIDFNALNSVEDDKLNSLLDSATSDFVGEIEYQEFKEDLCNAKELVYLTDNCGEVVLDKLFIKCIKKYYPKLPITVIVKGEVAQNDATMEDAKMVGLTDVAQVIGNGVGIAGTCLNKISQEAKEHIMNADIIISKGQGNFETLNGCGLNIYYVFLCKCNWFVKNFGLEQFKGVFMNEKNVKR